MRAQHRAQRRARLRAQLQSKIQEIEGGGSRLQAGPAASGGWCRLARGVVHEWFGLVDPDESAVGGSARRKRPDSPWIPPLGVLLQLAGESLQDPSSSGRSVVFIGRRCWPYPHANAAIRGDLLRRSVFVDPPDAGSRLWAIDLAVRCPAAVVVVADGSGLELAATRRLQLAAERGGALVLVARPPEELDRLSAAATRWLVRWASSADKTPRWIVELLRLKAAQRKVDLCASGGDAFFRPRRWTVEWKHAQGGVVVPAALRDRSDRAGQIARRSA